MSWRAVRGAAIAALWLYTIFAGFFVLYAPVLPLLLINHTIYRIVVDEMFALWQLYPVALFQWIFDCKLHHYGDFVNSEETSLIIMNHRTRVDWNYAWIALYHISKKSQLETKNTLTDNMEEDNEHLSDSTEQCYDHKDGSTPAQKMRFDKSNKTKRVYSQTIVDDEAINRDCSEVPGDLTNDDLQTKKESLINMVKKMFHSLTKSAKLKLVLKDEIKYIPTMGWIMQLNHFLFLKRNWSQDQTNVNKFLNYYRSLQRSHKYNIQLLMFPEGTDLSPSNQRASDAYAAANNLQYYDFVLHPRTTGFAVLTSRMREMELAAVYDVTLAYDHPPGSELSLARGEGPENVFVDVKRYPAADLPQGEDLLRRWLLKRWNEKETRLNHFHNQGTFAAKPNQPRSLHRAIAAFFFWTCIDVLFFYGLLTSGLFQFWVIYNVLLFAAITWRFGGFHGVQSALYDHK